MLQVDKMLTFTIDIMSNDFLTLSGAVIVLCVMDRVTGLEAREPSEDVNVLLNQLNLADPDAPDIDEDNSNENWGHMQFTAGGLTIQSALVDWQVVGSTSTTFKLIAAAIRTCKVARVLCAARGRITTAYLADNYLKQLFEWLEYCWKDAQASSANF